MTDKEKETDRQDEAPPQQEETSPTQDSADITQPTEVTSQAPQVPEVPQMPQPIAPPAMAATMPPEPADEPTSEPSMADTVRVYTIQGTGVEPSSTAETTLDLNETDESTLGDITLGEIDAGGFREWLRNLWKRFAWPIRPKSAAPSAVDAAELKRRRLRPWHWVLIGVGALVLAFSIFVAFDAGFYYDKVHYGISVLEQDLGHMTRDEAVQHLTALVEEAQSRPIMLKSDDYTRKVLPADLDTDIDVQAAVDAAMAKTRDGNVVVDLGRKISLYFSGLDVPLQGTVNSSKMDALLANISSRLDVPAASATLRVVDGEIEVVEGSGGSVVDQESLRASLTQLLFALHDTELPIPMIETSPDMQAIDLEPALAEAKVMVGTEVALAYQGQTIATITPTEMLDYLDIAKETDGETSKATPVLSAEKMVGLFDTLEPKVGTPPVDATFEMDLDGEEPYPLVLVEGVDGEALDREGTALALTQAALKTTGRVANVVLKPVEPSRTGEDLEAMGIKDLLGDYRTAPYVGSANRQSNVRLGVSLCSGTFLAPGEEFNTDQRLGVRSAANGWQTAPGIVGPGELEDVLGGGICQVSTTLFNAALLAGLEIVERHNHSIYISHYNDPTTHQGGRDATVSAGGKNMRFRNDTDHYIFIYGWSTGINTRFWIWGVDDGRVVQPIKWSGFTIGGLFPTQTIIDKSLPVGATEEDFEGQRSRSCSITRTIVYADGTEKSETWSSTWRQLPKVIRTNPKPDTTTTKAPKTTTTVKTSTTEAPTPPTPPSTP